LLFSLVCLGPVFPLKAFQFRSFLVILIRLGFTMYVVGTMPSPNAVSEIATANDFIVFPNPVTESATIQWNAGSTEEGNLEIFNAQGQLVYNERYVVSAGAQNMQLNTSSLTSGIYLACSTSKFGVTRQTSFVK